MSKVFRLPLALIIAATMVMTLVSAVAAAPSAGAGASNTALTDHAPEACVVLEGATAADLEANLMAELEALDGELLLDEEALAALRAELAVVADFGGTACVDLDTLTVYTEVCVTDLEVLAELLTEEEFRGVLLDLIADAEIVVDAELEAALALLGIDAEIGDVLGVDVDLTGLTTDQLSTLVATLELGLAAPVCAAEVAIDIGDIVAVVDTEIVCVEITAVGELTFEVVFGDDALLDDALLAELGALLATLDLEVGDVVCVALIPVDGDFMLGPVVVIVAGDVNVNIGDVVIGDITIGDCSNAVITVIVNGQNVDVDVVQNVDGQCVAVVPAPDDDDAAPDDDDDAAPDDDTPGMLPDTSVTDAPVYGGLLLALVALVSVGTLGYANFSARRNR